MLLEYLSQTNYYSMKFLSLITILLTFSCYAQLEVYPTSPTYMENGDLFGPNYLIYDAEFSGSDYAYAQFNGVNSNLGLKRGFVMTTGRLADPEEGILGPNNNESSGYDLAGVGGYSLLSNLIGGVQTHDAAVLDFMFIPYTDTLVFNYSFGSEEYEEFIGSQFNDPAAVFLIGPGAPTPINVLKISGDNVGVNTVHGPVTNQFGTYPAINDTFYLSNPVSSDITKIEFDGFTVNTQARIEGLQIGEEYRMIVAIADAGDGQYDSGLFIEACETCVPTLGEVVESSELEFSLAPNPAISSIIIAAQGDHSYRISNALGSVVLSGEITDSKEISIVELPQGTYFVQLENGQIARFIKR
ncbi:MAG: hypothetical protein Crog4KO_25410 [Crocinitomicaceae bacterium]